MAFSINDLATELGIDPSTLAAKGDVVAKWNGYLSNADTQYQESARAKKDALEAVERTKREQEVIDAQIAKFGVSETRVAELESAVAARDAAIEKAKSMGFTFDIPAARATPTPAPKPDQTAIHLNQFGQLLKVQSKYQAVYGKPYADDLEQLINDANAQRLPIYDFAARKYDFAGEEKRKSDADLAAKRTEWETAAVKKYQEENPMRTPIDQRGRTSAHSQIHKPREASADKNFRNLPVKERIAQSVARSRAAFDQSVA